MGPAYCRQCKRKTEFEIETRPVEGMDDTTENFVVCSVCKTEISAGYMNKALERMQSEIKAERHPIRQAKIIRRYHRRFEEFQAEVTRFLDGRTT